MATIRPRFLPLVLMIASTLHATAQQPEWSGFTPYPGARAMCSQSVLGQQGEEILWYSYATKDKTSRVIAFYVKDNDGKPNQDKQGQAEQSGNTLSLRRDDTVLSVQVAAADYPGCGHKVRVGERTVIIVSRMVRRGKQ